MLTLTGRSTQKKITESQRTLYFREDQDILNLIAYVLKGNAVVIPLMTGKSGFVTLTDNVRSIFDEILFIQRFYRKTGGIRMRHQIITMDFQQDLTKGQEMEQVRSIAALMSQFYLYKGFQNVWSVFFKGDDIAISFAINTVCCFDGSKYHYNKKDVLDEENTYLSAIHSMVVKQNGSWGYIDYTPLEFYPYSV